MTPTRASLVGRASLPIVSWSRCSSPCAASRAARCVGARVRSLTRSGSSLLRGVACAVACCCCTCRGRMLRPNTACAARAIEWRFVAAFVPPRARRDVSRLRTSADALVQSRGGLSVVCMRACCARRPHAALTACLFATGVSRGTRPSSWTRCSPPLTRPCPPGHWEQVRVVRAAPPRWQDACVSGWRAYSAAAAAPRSSAAMAPSSLLRAASRSRTP